MSITENASQYYIGQEENEGDGFPDKRGGKSNGVYFFRDESGNLIYTGTDHDEWYDFKQEYTSQQQADSEESTEEEVVDEDESMDEEVVDEEYSEEEVAEEEVVDEEESMDEEVVDEDESMDSDESTEEEVVDEDESIDEGDVTNEEVVDEDESVEEDDVAAEDLEDTTVYSPSNAGEPIENPDIPADTNDGNDLNKLDFSSQYSSPNGGGSDTYTGTGGVNTYDFNPLLNATPEIIEKHTNNNGKIDWRGVTGENDNRHDHWVESLGNDTIMDFSGQGGDGDKINITGHTVAADVIEESDGQVVLGVYSDQGADGSRGNGAHDLDILGTITVNHDGNFSFGRDVNVNANDFSGVREFA